MSDIIKDKRMSCGNVGKELRLEEPVFPQLFVFLDNMIFIMIP